MKLRILIFVVLLSNTLFSQSFHDTQGKLDISSSGQAVYTLPIAMPPSIGSVGPTINLVYASGQTGGIAGQGWSINAISNICRIATRKDIDGFIDGVDFDDNDKLALDGQRLLLVPGTGAYWADHSQYQTEVQSNTKIQLFGTTGNMYFIVTSPDGSRSWYGNYNGMNATDVTAYYITRFEDTNGNYITYEYSYLFLKTLCVTQINFSANVHNQLSLNKIKFKYSLAKRREFSYVGGQKVEKLAILNGVEVRTDDKLFRNYTISHIKDPQLGYEKVSRITEYNGDGEAANPVIFEYNDTPSNSGDYMPWSLANPNVLDFRNIKSSGDFNGDGQVDYLTSNQLFVNHFDANSGQNPTTTPVNIPYSQGKRLRFDATTLTNNKLNQFQSLIYVDEQIDRINFKTYDLIGSSIQNTFTKSILIDNIAHCESFCTACQSDTYIKNSNSYIEGDFNGDGVTEVLLFDFVENKVFQSTDTEGVLGSNRDPSFATDCTPMIDRYPSEIVRLIDLNPNSSTTFGEVGNLQILNTDLLFRNGGLPDKDKITVMDFNGDGKMDLF